MRPTRLGVQALAFWALLVIAFYSTPYQNLFFLLLTFLTVLLVLTPWWARKNLRRMAGEVLAIEPAPAGSPALARIRLSAQRRRRFQVACVLRLQPARAELAVVPALDGETTLDGRLPVLARGVHRVVECVLESSYPFGLVRVRRPMAAPPDVVVHPAPDLGELRGADAALHRTSRLARADDPAPAGLRDWREGDALRDVHWRASARRRSLVVKEHEDAPRQGAAVVLDRRVAGEAFERALSLVQAVAVRAQQRKERLAFYTQGTVASFGPGQRPWDELARLLAAANPLPGDGPPPPRAPGACLHVPLVEASR